MIANSFCNNLNKHLKNTLFGLKWQIKIITSYAIKLHIFSLKDHRL